MDSADDKLPTSWKLDAPKPRFKAGHLMVPTLDSTRAVSPPPAAVKEPSGATSFTGRESGSEDDEDPTLIIAPAQDAEWYLVLGDGTRLPLDQKLIVLGRNPRGSELGVQYLAVPDRERTMSKTHARLKLDRDTWFLTDLNSTNGVLVEQPDGTTLLLEPGKRHAVDGRFKLGRVTLKIERGEQR